MAEPIRVGIVGANPGRGWALSAHLPALAVLPGFEVVAVATTRQASADETAKMFGIPHAFGDARELITSDDVDVVSICVKVPQLLLDYVRAGSRPASTSTANGRSARTAGRRSSSRPSPRLAAFTTSSDCNAARAPSSTPRRTSSPRATSERCCPRI